jgi:hypothetical protein
LVFDGLDSQPQSNSRTCTFTEKDRERVLALKLWWSTIGRRKYGNLYSIASSTTTTSTEVRSSGDSDIGKNLSPSKFTKTIEQLIPDSFCDIIGQVGERCGCNNNEDDLGRKNMAIGRGWIY